MRKFLPLAGLFMAGPTFSLGLAMMQPQMSANAEMEGSGSFMRSLAAEPTAWANSHILLLVAAILYILAGLGVHDALTRSRPFTSQLLGLVIIAGAAMLIGNFGLDFVYLALATGLSAETAQAARLTLLNDEILQPLFANIGPALFLLGMFFVALIAVITNWIPRITALPIVAGWAIIMGLHGAFPYAEALGHFIVGIGFWVVGFAYLKSARDNS